MFERCVDTLFGVSLLASMARLSRADMEAALAFGAEVSAAAPQPERADDRFLELIAAMISCDVADYSYHGDGRPQYSTTYPLDPGAGPWTPTEHEWEVIEAEHPFCLFAERTRDPYFSAQRLTDVVVMRDFITTEFFALNLCAVAERPHALQMRVAARARSRWQLNLSRGGRDFTARDCLILDVMRAPLIAYEAHRELMAIVAQLRSARFRTVSAETLSPRENEILDLVAMGASNAEIAVRLLISPLTVKKHLEHIYLKLEVGNRTAALAFTGRSASSPLGSESAS